MPSLKTIQVEMDDFPGPVCINEDDFNPAIHRRPGTKKPDEKETIQTSEDQVSEKPKGK